MADDDSMIGPPIRVPSPRQVVKSPDEAIAGGAFTLIEAGLLGQPAGAPSAAGYLLEPAPEPFTRSREEPPEEAPQSDGALAKYVQGDELPQAGAGGGGFSGMLADLHVLRYQRFT